MSSEKTSHWNPDSYYSISRWSEGYFGVNKKGNLAAYTSTGSEGIDFMDIIHEMKTQNIPFPTVIRFHDILRDRVKSLNKAFIEAIDQYNYDGSYTGVFPIKVNQMREVVEEVVDAGTRYNYGLEAGSKPELIAVLAYNKNRNSLTVLNGYKDKDYIRLALLGNKMGRNCCIVVENFSEVQNIIEISKEMKIKPMIGLRAKLSAKSRGKWASSSGDRAKFGLTIPEILNTVALLKANKMEDSIKLFHFHIGSQISDIGIFKEAISEGARIFSKLCKMNLKLEYFDVGGGLGVDYDGTKSKNDSSKNYNLYEYAADIVSTLKDICDEEGVDHPNIVSESGRAISAHHSCVITNVLGTIQPYNDAFDTKKKTGEHSIVKNIREAESLLNKNNFQEMFNDATGYREDCTNAFKLGILKLEERAKVETIYWRILHKVNQITKSMEFVSEEFADLENQLAKHYLCNFSVFQSAADIWAVGQLLPLLPITRLNEEPTENCTIADITCDSDGKITQFINSDDACSNTVKLHKLNDEPYYIGLFLTGAYQDVMGDMHNLFGRLNEVHVFYDSSDESNFYIEEVIRGSSSEMVLSTMQYNPDYMAARVKKIIDKQIKAGKIAPREGVRLNDFYEDCLKDYTYLKTD
ncbi:MAG: biosynthetic arginine decarboxylase [Lentisphaeraceae bacterium]|nr:biosynthetic arginine decarboxylase [Lentisphaeraceae bacterium]